MPTSFQSSRHSNAQSFQAHSTDQLIPVCVETMLARLLSQRLPEAPAEAVNQLELLLEQVIGAPKSLILLYQEESGVFQCWNDLKEATKTPRELTCLDDQFLQTLLGCQVVRHVPIELQGELLGLLAVGNDHSDSLPDEVLIEQAARYIALPLWSWTTLRQTKEQPWLQQQLLQLSEGLLQNLTQADTHRELGQFCLEQFDAGTVQLIRWCAANDAGETVWQQSDASVVHGVDCANQSAELLRGSALQVHSEVAGLLSLLRSTTREAKPLYLQQDCLGDKALSEVLHVPYADSALLVPIHEPCNDRLWGMLSLIPKSGQAPYNKLQQALAVKAVGLFAQTIERARLSEQALAQATQDPLTSLLNRRGLERRFSLEQNRAKRYKRALALVLIDLDHFKRLNDTHGHLVGDIALKRFARFLEDSLRSSDSIARFGGEEFILLLPDTDVQSATDLIERLKSQVSDGLACKELANVQLSFSAGVVSVLAEQSPRPEGLQETLAFADTLLYQAKREGRNRVVAPTF